MSQLDLAEIKRNPLGDFIGMRSGAKMHVLAETLLLQPRSVVPFYEGSING
jgi:hypothetical protein